MTCHNRKQKTLSCLRSIFQANELDLGLNIFLVDDGSTDGTSLAVTEEFPQVRQIHASGELYWAKGMALAEQNALRDDPDFILWLNDDVVLEGNALSELMDISASHPEDVIIGALREIHSNEMTYGALRRSRWHPQRFFLIHPKAMVTQKPSSFNGNCVLIPRIIYQSVGPIDSRFQHAYADLDYGLRTVDADYGITQSAVFIGKCSRDTPRAFSNLSQEWAFTFSEKGRPLKSQKIFLRSHGGFLWPLFLATGIARTITILLWKYSLKAVKKPNF